MELATGRTVDVIVVGAGAAGCAVARRLADAGRRVVLVEAGPGLPGPDALASIDAVAALARPERFWVARLHQRLARAAPAGMAVPGYTQGFGVGGGTAVNAMVATIGDLADYDRWATDRGCQGWDGTALAPWLAGASITLGRTVAEPGPLTSALAGAVGAAGHPVGGASDEPDRVGLMAAALTARHGRRRSAADAYTLAEPSGSTAEPSGSTAEPLGSDAGPSGSTAGSLGSDAGPSGSAAGSSGSTAGPVEGQEANPVLITGVAVERLTTRGNRVTGVTLAGGADVPARSVVLCAGALATPLLLERSGLAPRRRWPVADHPSFVFTLELRGPARQDPHHEVPAVSSVFRWASEPGRAAGVRADLMAMVMDHVGSGPEGRRYGAVIVLLGDVASIGSVEAGEGGEVVVDPGWLIEAEDRRRFRLGVRQLGDLLRSEAVGAVSGSVFLDDRGTPLDLLDALDDDQLDRWLLAHPGPVRHPSSSVPMSGAAARSDCPGVAVDLDGAVIGWDGVFVADAAALPHVPNANPMLPVVAVAERLTAGMIDR